MNSIEPSPAGNYYDKYGTRNPIARYLMNGFLHAFDRMVEQCGRSRTALEAGCGEGELSIRLARRGLQVRAFDPSSEIVEEARQRCRAAAVSVDLHVASIGALEASKQWDLVVCCEVLEHLDDPRDAVRRLARACSGHLLFSVPREPLWRALNMARGRYLAHWGNTPGHLQHWSRRGFVAMLSEQLDVVAVRSPLPWTMVLCTPRHRRPDGTEATTHG